MYRHMHSSEQSEDYNLAWDSAKQKEHASSMLPQLEDTLFDTGATEMQVVHFFKYHLFLLVFGLVSGGITRDQFSEVR